MLVAPRQQRRLRARQPGTVAEREVEVAGEIGRPAWDGDAAAGGVGGGEEGRADLVGGRGEWETGGAEVQVREARVECWRRRRRRRRLHGGRWCTVVGAVGWLVWLTLWCGGWSFDGSADCFLLALSILGRGSFVFIFIVLVELRQRVRNVLQLHHGAFLAEIKRVHMHGADEAWEGHLLEFVVDEVADGVGEGEAGWSGREGGPVDGNGHLHGFVILGGD